MRRDVLLRAGALALALIGAVALARAAEPLCPPDPPLARLDLPHLRAALEAGRPGVIVALGSSSTEGVMASGPEAAYPAELQEALEHARPGWRIQVVNRGIGGQDARLEVARIGADVLALHPHMVIWQVGANAALRDNDPLAFRRLVTEGVQRLQAHGADVVLMDNQRAPRLLAAPEDAAFDTALAAVAAETGAGLFSRDRLMRGWAASGDPPADFIAADRLHHNDRGYACVARALARAIEAGLGEVTPELSAGR
ncbi:MAG: SGNH/GDSL hydrolase family protein [Acetobacteraceae bacterium]